VPVANARPTVNLANAVVDSEQDIVVAEEHEIAISSSGLDGEQ